MVPVVVVVVPVVVPVKVGVGGYEEKIERLIKLEKDIKAMGVPIDYIDLRFERKAIVKPMIEKMLK